MPRLARSINVAGLILALSTPAQGQWRVDSRGGDIGFIEEFALAKDRAEALKKLIPGTEDYYYFHALHYLNSSQFDKAAALFKPWFERFKQTPGLTEIQTRHALLSYDKNPRQSLDYFKTKLGLAFNHQQIVQGVAPNLPTALDPSSIYRETLAKYSSMRWQQHFDNYEDSALDWLLTLKLNPDLRRHALARLVRPDVDNLAKIVAEDLNTKDSGGFGSLNIHRQMTLDQLDELLKLKPELLNQTNFVHAWTVKLQPGDDEDWRRDPTLTRAYLDRLLAFTRKLAPAFNPFKAHVLFHRLVPDQNNRQAAEQEPVRRISCNCSRFQGYMSKAMLESDILRRNPADLNANYSGA